jgi:hypothetical protein
LPTKSAPVLQTSELIVYSLKRNVEPVRKELANARAVDPLGSEREFSGS